MQANDFLFDDSPDQANWLSEQISLMENWLAEKRADPRVGTDEIETLQRHLSWLQDRLKAIAGN
ncbi:hypothetical protein [Ponticaulis profundi]|uniref:Uncharacterized protein n=1 Tax=Ponticaulis profundi TaxID=2665222 RepID=A0ABW1S4S6_9PROT